uniref:Uncharacterized protein n=1 Tax=Rhizophora mucronata TaxID=61149 RepID=A0A2P2J374_RHIMU
MVVVVGATRRRVSSAPFPRSIPFFF